MGPFLGLLGRPLVLAGAEWGPLGSLLAGLWFGLELSGALLVNFVPGHTRTHEKAWEASAGMFDSDVIAVLLLVLLLLLLLLSRLLHSMEKNVCPPPHASRLQIQNAKQSSRRPHANRVFALKFLGGL